MDPKFGDQWMLNASHGVCRGSSRCVSPSAAHPMGWADATSPPHLGTAELPEQAASACSWRHWPLIFRLPFSLKKSISNMKAM